LKNLAVLFDLDGTLIDSLADICGAINRVRQLHGFPERPITNLRTYIGKGVEYLIQGSFPEYPESRHAEIVEEYRAFYLREPHHGGRVFPGVPEALARLRAEGIKLAIATNKSSLVAEKTLEYYLPNFPFELVAGPERVSRRKPDPAHLWEPLAKMGIAPQDAWFVGDDPVDEQCARAAGVRFLGAIYGIGGVQVPDSERLTQFSDLPAKLGL
jgi:phosphoglycolate phosphatase